MSDQSPRFGAVFLSYAREDSAAAQRIADALRASGVEVWFDQSTLRGGDSWDSTIRQRIKDCGLFLPIISASTQARPEGYFRLEWRLGDQRTHLMGRSKAFVVPVCIDDTIESRADVPDSFLAAHWTRLPGGEVDAAFCDHVKKLLGSRNVHHASLSASVEPHVIRPGIAHEVGRTTASRMPPKGRYRSVVLAALAVVVIAGLIGFAVHSTRKSDATKALVDESGASTAKAVESVAVLAFEDKASGESHEFFSDGISKELMVSLGRVPGLRVVAWTSAFFFKKSDASPQEIGRMLGANHLVTGTVQREGEMLRIFAHLIRAQTGEQLWSERYLRPAKDLFTVEDEIARDIARNLRLKLGVDVGGSMRTVDPEAFRLVARGRHYWSDRTAKGSALAEADFLQALKLDPDFAQAHAGLADVYLIRGIWQLTDARSTWLHDMRKARESAERALQLDGDLAEAVATLGYVYFYTGDQRGAESLLKKSIALNPNLVTARGYYAIVLNAQGLLDRSLVQSNAAVEIDPLSSINLVQHAISLKASGRFAEALPFARRALGLAKDQAKATSLLFAGTVFLAGGAREEALAAARSIIRGDRIDVTGAFATVSLLRKAGLEEEAAAAARMALAQLPPTDYRYGMVLVAAGRFDEALPALEQTPAAVWAPSFFWYDMWDPYRDDPRFHALLVKLGLDDDYRIARAAVSRTQPGKK